MLVSSDSGILGHARHLTTQAKSDTLYYTHDEVGYNYRMTNLQAALGLAQLENLEQFVRVKTDNFNYYMERVSWMYARGYAATTGFMHCTAAESMEGQGTGLSAV